jgi:hypothetical protein
LRVPLNPILLSIIILVTAVKVLEALQSQGNMLECHLATLFHATTYRRGNAEFWFITGHTL